MAILIRWTVPDAGDIDYDKVQIHRASTEGGAYSQIAVQNITDNNYFDADGSTTDFYKIKFLDNSTSDTSTFSDPLQGGTYIGYCSLNYVRDINNLTTADISDTEFYALIQKATTILNSDINTQVIRERVIHIDNTRTNDINGSNTLFYIKNFKGKYIGDMNDSGGISTADIIVYQVTSDGTETKLTVSAIDSDDGNFTLSSAPSSGVDLYVTYMWCYEDPSLPSNKIALAAAFLATAFAHEKINRGMSPSQVFGNVRLMRDMQAGNEYFKKYRDMVDKINSKVFVYTQASTF